MLDVRIANVNDTDQIRDLWDYCFYEDPQYLSWVFGEQFQPDNTVVAVRDGRVIGALQLIPYTIRIREKVESCYYICGVSVQPEARSMGAAASMMEFAERTARDRGISLLLLIPALGGYYERFGYVHCTSKEEYEFPVPLAAGRRFKGSVRHADKPGLLLQVYQKYASYWDVAVERTEADFAQLMQCFAANLHTGTFVFMEGETPVAYLLCRVTPQEVNVPECAYINENGANAVLQFISSHSMQVKRAVLRTAPGDPVFTKLYQTGVRRIATPSFMAKKIGCCAEETFEYFGAGSGKAMELFGKAVNLENKIYLNLPQWY